MQKNVSNQHYPPATGAYKVFIKGNSTWQGHTTARLQISMGNPKQDGEKLLAMTEWAAARFDKVVFVISDTLQRHNISLRHGVSLQDAHEIALIGGHEWMARNKKAIDSVPQRIVTLWDDWLAHPEYAASRRELNELYAKDQILQEAVAAKAFRFCKANDPVAMATSTEFLLEEIAAIAIMFRTPAADFYAGTWLNEIYAAIARLPASGLMDGFKNIYFTEVDFKRNQRPLNNPSTSVHKKNLTLIKPAF